MKLFYLLPLLMALTACANKPPIVQTTTQYVVVVPDEKMLEDCPSTPPPHPTIYSQATDAEKEKLLYNFNQALQTKLAECNVQIKITREWFPKQKAIYEKKK